MHRRRTTGAGIVLITALIAAALAAPAQASAADLAAAILARAPVTGPTVDLLIGPRPGRAGGVEALAARLGAHDRGALIGMSVRRVRVPAAVAAELIRTLAADPAVAYVERDAPVQATLIPDDPYYPHGYQPGLDLIGAPAAWDTSTGIGGPVIAVIDTGVDASHEDLGGRVLPGIDLVNGDDDPNDDNGHGTHVAGIAAATGNNGIGGAGVCWGCSILPVKVLGAGASGTYSAVAAGITWAADHGAQIINMSLGGSSDSETLADAVAYAEAKGIVVVAAAGNSGSTNRFYPAAMPGVIAVAAAVASALPGDTTTWLYDWSNYGADWVAVAAPGCTISTWPGNAYQSDCGTSMATPFVSGSIGLLMAADPAATAAEAANAMLGTAGPQLRDGTADGIIHTDVALAALLAGTVPEPIPTATPTPSPTPTPDPTPSPDVTPTPDPTPTPATDPSPTPTADPTPTASPTPAFELSALPASRSVAAGQQASYTIDLTRSNLPDPVDLSLSGLPAGAAAAFSPDPADGSSSILTIAPSGGDTSTPSGDYDLTITGQAAGLTRSTTVTLVVTDGVGPAVTPPAARLMGGSTLGLSSLPVRVLWSATDASGIAVFHLERQVNGGTWAVVSLPAVGSTSIDQAVTIGALYRYRVSATDGAGNTSTWAYGAAFRASLTQQSSSAVAYHGSWRSSSLSAASAKSLKYARAGGAWARYGFAGSSIAWVAYRGPTRGSAKVYVDGVYKATVNLHAASNHARAITYVFNAGSNGSHVLKIVLVGTPAHPRVDLDVFARIVLY